MLKYINLLFFLLGFLVILGESLNNVVVNLNTTIPTTSPITTTQSTQTTAPMTSTQFYTPTTEIINDDDDNIHPQPYPHYIKHQYSLATVFVSFMIVTILCCLCCSINIKYTKQKNYNSKAEYTPINNPNYSQTYIPNNLNKQNPPPYYNTTDQSQPNYNKNV